MVLPRVIVRSHRPHQSPAASSRDPDRAGEPSTSRIVPDFSPPASNGSRIAICNNNISIRNKRQEYFASSDHPKPLILGERKPVPQPRDLPPSPGRREPFSSTHQPVSSSQRNQKTRIHPFRQCNNPHMTDQPQQAQPEAGPSVSNRTVSRRALLATCTAAGLAHTLFPGALLALVGQAPMPLPTDAAPQKITPAMLDAAAAIAGITLTDEQKTMMLEGVTSQRESVLEVRKLPLPNSVAPSFLFDPVPPGTVLQTMKQPAKLGPAPAINLPAGASVEANTEALAYLTVRQLAELIRTRRITSTTLTKMYHRPPQTSRPQAPLRHHPHGRARPQAGRRKLDLPRLPQQGSTAAPSTASPGAGKTSSPLRATPPPGEPPALKTQHLRRRRRSRQAPRRRRGRSHRQARDGRSRPGRPLWLPRRKRQSRRPLPQPMEPRPGFQSGSSAGSASAAAAGCVGFAHRHGNAGQHLLAQHALRCHRPAALPSASSPAPARKALSAGPWTRSAPSARSVEDCALVLSAIYGQDGRDLTVQPAAFNWDATVRLAHSAHRLHQIRF